jgi:G3E family GTPase
MMGIESPLITDAAGQIFDKFYELPNGCICCSAKKDLQTAIEYLIANEKYELDFILVETNGLADPSSTIKMFWVGEELKFPARLQGIMALVAAHTFDKHSTGNEIFLRQLIFADLVLLNHADRVTEEKGKEIELAIKELNPTATIKRTKYCETDIDEIFGSEGLLSKLRDKDDLSQLHKETEHHHHHPDEDIQFQIFEYKNVLFDPRALEENLGGMIWEHPNDANIMRVKGIFASSTSNCKYSVQGVDEIFEVKESEVNWEKDGDRISKFLLVGKKLARPDIEAVFNKSMQNP